MPLLSSFWRSINRKARVVVSEWMRLMTWTADDEETALCNFGDFGRFLQIRSFSGFSGYGFFKAKTFGMYPLPFST